MDYRIEGGVFAKPFMLDDLARKVRELLDSQRRMK